MLMWGLIVIFVVLMLFPLGYAMAYKKHEVDILNIQQDRTREPRYFGQAFSRMMRRELMKNHENKEEKITLSKEEAVHYTSQDILYDEKCEKVVVAEEEVFIPPTQIDFEKEIYAKYNACIKQDTQLRAIYAEGNMILGNQTKVIRWADANGTLAVYDNCELGISTTSASMMTIGKNCRFKRLYAPIIFLGQYPDELMEEPQERKGRTYQLKVQKERRKNIAYIKDDMIDEEGVVPFTVITQNDLVVTEHLIIQGDIRSAKGVRLCEGAVVCGNIFAEHDVLLGKNTIVLGNVFAQGSIKMQDGVVVGRKENKSSVIARDHITIEKRALVYGYIGCESGGRVWPLIPEENQEREHTLKFLVNNRQIEEVVFDTVEAYEQVNELGYRHCHSLKRVVIPEGVRVVNKSMFYDCIHLEEIVLPSTIQIIGEYAFAGCTRLRNINLEELQQLQHIEMHAFEGCKNLKKVSLPKSLLQIDNAAFAGCTRLETFHLENREGLKELGTHIWIGTPLRKENLNIPESLLGQEKWLVSTLEEREAIEAIEETDALKEIDAIEEIDTLAKRDEKICLEGHTNKPEDFTCLSIAKLPVRKRRKGYERIPRFKEARTRRQIRQAYLLQGVGALVGVILLGSMGVIVYNQQRMRQEEEQILVASKSLYHNQGLRSDAVLDETPNQVTQEYVAYKDRVLKRYNCNEAMLDKQIKLYKQISDTIAEGVKQTTMIVPLRIQYEESAQAYVGKMAEDVDYIAANLPQDMKYVDLFKALEPYQDRYIFYRTEPYWTSEGAYYGTNAYRKAFSKKLPDLVEYEEYLYLSMVGPLYLDVYPNVKQELELCQDQLYYYLNPKSHNRETVYRRNHNKTWEYSQEPIVSKARGGLNSFVGGTYSYAVMDGQVNNGKALLVLGDKHIDMMATYLIGEYEKVIFVNNLYFKSSYQKNTKQAFLNLFSEYGITEFLYVQGASVLGDKLYLDKTYALFCEDEKRNEIWEK